LGGFNVINCQGGEKETARAVGNLFIRCKFQINQIVQVLLSNLISGKLRPDEMKRETIISFVIVFTGRTNSTTERVFP
jgi:hypothetical protein